MHLLALHVSNSLLKVRGRGKGGSPNPATVCNFCVPPAVYTVHHNDTNDDELCDQDRKRVLQCCFQIDFLQLPWEPPPLPAPSLCKHYEESCNYKESTFTLCQVQKGKKPLKSSSNLYFISFSLSLSTALYYAPTPFRNDTISYSLGSLYI